MRVHSHASGAWLPVLLFGLLTTSTIAAPTPKSELFDNFGELMGSKFDLKDLSDTIQSGIQTIVALVQALKAGQINQNGLIGAGANNASITANGTLANGTASITKACPDVAVLFARGTNEPGNMGFLVGPPFTTALQHYANGSRVAMQGITYPANVDGFRAGGDAAGALSMAALANATTAACPGAKLVLSGYSQGAQVVRKACGLMGASTAGALASVVLFGDPQNGTALAGVAAARVMTLCHAGDDICRGGDSVLPAHLNYSGDVPAAAAFVMKATGLGMASKDADMVGMGDIPMMTMAEMAGRNGLGDVVVMSMAKEGEKKGDDDDDDDADDMEEKTKSEKAQSKGKGDADKTGSALGDVEEVKKGSSIGGRTFEDIE